MGKGRFMCRMCAPWGHDVKRTRCLELRPFAAVSTDVEEGADGVDMDVADDDGEPLQFYVQRRKELLPVSPDEGVSSMPLPDLPPSLKSVKAYLDQAKLRASDTAASYLCNLSALQEATALISKIFGGAKIPKVEEVFIRALEDHVENQRKTLGDQSPPVDWPAHLCHRQFERVECAVSMADGRAQLRDKVHEALVHAGLHAQDERLHPATLFHVLGGGEVVDSLREASTALEAVAVVVREPIQFRCSFCYPHCLLGKGTEDVSDAEREKAIAEEDNLRDLYYHAFVISTTPAVWNGSDQRSLVVDIRRRLLPTEDDTARFDKASRNSAAVNYIWTFWLLRGRGKVPSWIAHGRPALPPSTDSSGGIPTRVVTRSVKMASDRWLKTAKRNELAALVDNVRDGKGPFIHIEFDGKETVTADVKKASDTALDGNGDSKYDVPNDKLVEVVKRITSKGQEFHRLLQLPEFAEHREKLEQAVKDATVGTKWKAVGRSRPATGNEIECPALAAALKSKQAVREHEANEKVDVEVKVFSKEEVDTFGLKGRIASDSVIKAGDVYYRQAAYGRQLRTLLAAWTAPAFVCRNGI